jgi:hypothetical protein
VKQSSFLIASIVLFGVSVALSATYAKNEPSRDPKTETRLKQPTDIVGTKQRARELLTNLRESSWDLSKIDPSLLRVNDQDFAQFPEERSPDYPTFALPFVNTKTDIYKGQIGLFTSLYVHVSKIVVPGSEAIVTHSGPVIVGWMDGRVEEVPIEDVRLYRAEGDPISRWVFPGMRQYDPSLPPIDGRSTPSPAPSHRRSH